MLLDKIEELHREYFGNIGTFVELVSQASSKAGIKLKIALVATKCENETARCGSLDESCAKVIEMTKDHLTSLMSRLYLVNEVIRTSCQEVTRGALEGLHNRVAILCLDGKLRVTPEEMRPLSWHKFLGVVSQKTHMSLEEADDLWEDEKHEVGEATNISPEALDLLKGFQNVVNIMKEVENSEESRVETHASKPHAEPKTGPTGVAAEAPKVKTEAVAVKTVQPKETQLLSSQGEVQRSLQRKGAGVDGMEEVKAIFSYFSDFGEVIWFKNHENIYDYVITQPTAFVKSLRTVITHKVQDKFRGVKFEDKMQDLLKRGCLSFKVFSEVYNKKDQDFTAREAWLFMKELGLAFPIEGGDGGDTVMIPCLINDQMEEKMKSGEKEMRESSRSVGLMYKFDRTTSTIWIYFKLLETFSQTFFGESGGTFDLAYSQKIEKRRLGTVGGIQGTLKWTTSTSGIQKPKLYSFLLLEYEITEDPFTNTQEPFALNRGVKFFVQPIDGEMTEDVFSILEKVDSAFSPHLGDVQRSLACKDCEGTNRSGYFKVQAGIKLESDISKCSESRHHLPEKIKDLMQRKLKPFEMRNLLEFGKSSLDLQPFEDSEIKRNMLSGKLKCGEQIWVFHA